MKNRKDIKKDYDKVDESAMGRTLKLVGRETSGLEDIVKEKRGRVKGKNVTLRTNRVEYPWQVISEGWVKRKLQQVTVRVLEALRE